jgi:hypothetical protein
MDGDYDFKVDYAKNTAMDEGGDENPVEAKVPMAGLEWPEE